MGDLGLQIQAERHLDFLLADGSYRCTESTPYRVRYESATTVIEIMFDGTRSYELGLLIRLLNSENPPFTIVEILRLRHAPEADSLSLIQVTTKEGLAKFVEKLVGALRKYGGEIIAGKTASFAALEEQRRNDGLEYALQRRLRAANVEAESAWREKDYGRVVKVLSPLRATLSAIDVGKLEFAEKQVRQGREFN